MTSTIKTSNDKLVTKIKNFLKRQKSFCVIKNFLKRQKSFCVTTCTNGIYAITIFDTDDLELFYQVERVIRHFNLTKQQEPKALAA